METAYEKLDKFIQEYVKKTFTDQGINEEGDYIASWALVVNYGNLDQSEGFAGGYLVESMPPKNPPHAIKGLLREGIDWVLDAQDGALYGDDDD
jgi:hypothetical protein